MTKAYKDGWKACDEGKSLKDNPYYLKGTKARMIEWRIGFEARAEIVNANRKTA